MSLRISSPKGAINKNAFYNLRHHRHHAFIDKLPKEMLIDCARRNSCIFLFLCSSRYKACFFVMMILGFTICLILHFSFKKKNRNKKEIRNKAKRSFVVWQFLIPFLRRRKKNMSMHLKK